MHFIQGGGLCMLCTMRTSLCVLSPFAELTDLVAGSAASSKEACLICVIPHKVVSCIGQCCATAQKLLSIGDFDSKTFFLSGFVLIKKSPSIFKFVCYRKVIWHYSRLSHSNSSSLGHRGVLSLEVPDFGCRVKPQIDAVSLQLSLQRRLLHSFFLFPFAVIMPQPTCSINSCHVPLVHLERHSTAEKTFGMVELSSMPSFWLDGGG